MRLAKVSVSNYRSVIDETSFEVEDGKTILVGANEAGKTAILQAIQHLNRPPEVEKLNPLRDFPRSRYHLIRTKVVNPDQTLVVKGWFKLEDGDQDELPSGFENATYWIERYASDRVAHGVEGGPPRPTVRGLSNDITRLLAHVRRAGFDEETAAKHEAAAAALEKLYSSWSPNFYLTEEQGNSLLQHLNAVLPLVDESVKAEEERHDRLVDACSGPKRHNQALSALRDLCPVFVLFNNYFRVRPRIQLDHLAARIEQKSLDDDYYDYGNQCLLKLLGFTARELSNLASAERPNVNDAGAVAKYQEKLDERHYQLNAASVRLTDEIRHIWAPDESRGEAAKVRIVSDGQYLKLVVEDSIGVEVELDQRSEGFQWLVSFFVVFFAEAADKHDNAVLLLDEPGMSLHGLKQREFRNTLSRLAENNQTIYTTHSPFLVGPDELDLVRVVEMKDRNQGTKVSVTVAASDSPALLPLQEALGYDMAQSLFAQQRNLVVEGLTDYWYVDAMSALLSDAGEKALDAKCALVPAGNAGKVVYFATILHAHKLKVAALLDSDAAGDQAAKQETLIHTLGQKAIMRTKDFYSGLVTSVEIEDLLRESLIDVAKSELGWDVQAAAAAAPARCIVDVFDKNVANFSKYKLAKAFLRWVRQNDATSLRTHEREAFVALFAHANKVLK
ncbi:AAA family ATPase [Pseudomarimonas arenosa]|uniref:AAA family ATPase n=1 Tax=Pseudomarimonas arenosa TaxID=2774145 RepID=A0AAW3ZQB3_9GAMM|nr:AAA family ATPase [Pseudomarimonas arenosa]MBD8527918.1 AAA family ATPase [Pseudomarimonas arenosa]